MNRANPAPALGGTRIGNICSSCNKGIRSGDLVHAYATYYDEDGWIIRRLWCGECGDTKIGRTTDGTDEVIISAIFWEHQLAGVKIADQSIAGERD